MAIDSTAQIASHAITENLQPWSAGQSGNPAGKPRLSTGLAKLVRDCTDDGLDIVYFLRDAVRDGVVRTVDASNRKVSTTPVTFRERLSAAEVLLDRGWGSPVQELVTESRSVAINVDADLATLSVDELQARVATLKELVAAEQALQALQTSDSRLQVYQDDT